MAKPGSILIVDDEETLRYVLNRKLSKSGYQCDEAGNAEQAIAKLVLKPSDLVVLDIEMPGKHGNELLPEIQTRFPETSVVMASGVTDTRVIAQCIKDGAQDYIRKPFTLDDVLLSVTLALEKHRLELQLRDYQKTHQYKQGLRSLFLGTIRTLVSTLEANDKYTAGHSQDVTEVALAIGQRLNMNSEELDDLYWGALLHDVGKVAIDPRILNKPGELTTEEYRHIMTHAMVGPHLVQPLVNDAVVSIISHHHDHYDGGGLNQLIARDDIPLGARIVAAADAFDAMTSDRPYRPAMSLPEAYIEMKRCSGTQFDPVVVNTLLGLSQHSI
ncbi:MAG: response regulator [Dehalococcoidales bacterium]|nr:response regulator [Dehalococcoidales bacterium]